MPLDIDVAMPRHAFTVRDSARAGDVWRAMQEVAITGSTLCGWPPRRYRAEGSAFVVRDMTVVHVREARYGEPLAARTWIGDFRRGILTRREIRIDGADGVVAAAAQEWVHVDASMRPRRAKPELLEAFTIESPEPSPELPAWERDDGPEHRFAFRAWHTWMDPLGHANHPAYLDWCDEATSLHLVQQGHDPVALVPIAERVSWKGPVEAGDEVVVLSRQIGRTVEGAIVQEHRIENGGVLAAKAVTVRTLLGGGW